MGLALAGLAWGCSGPTAPSSVQPPQRPPTQGPVTPPAQQGQAEPLHSIRGLLIGVPIYDGDFADPFVLSYGEGGYAYATNTSTANVPVVRWQGFDQADYLGDALPHLPAWTQPGLVWAPAVWARPDGTFVLYYTTLDTASGRQCISAATSADPAGPFQDSSTAPMVCPIDKGGAIDPSVVVAPAAPGQAAGTYLLWKSDGNCCALPTAIWSSSLTADGLATGGDPTQLVEASQDWQRGIIEGPSMFADGGELLLFFSGNSWDGADYAIGYARCATVVGPCTLPDDGPWMTSTTFAKGPGAQEFFEGRGALWMVYGAWLPGEVGEPDGQRRIYLDSVTVRDGAPDRIGREAGAFALGRALLPVGIGIAAVVALALAGLWWWRRRHPVRPPPPPSPAGPGVWHGD